MESLNKVRSIFLSPALRLIADWSRPVAKPVALISLLQCINALLSLAVTLVTKNLIDSATGGRISALWTCGSLLAGMIIAGRLLSICISIIQARAASNVQLELQHNIMDSILGKEYSGLTPFHSGDLVSRTFSDVAVVRNGLMTLAPSLLYTAVSFIGAVIILVRMDWRFIPLLILAALVGAALTAFMRDPLKRRHKRMQEAEAVLHANIQENLENIHLIKASVSEKRALENMDGYRKKLAEEQIRNRMLSIALNNGMAGIFDASSLVCYLWGCFKICQGSLTYGSLAALIQLMGRIQYPIANAVQMISSIYGMTASAERLMEVLGLPDEAEGETLDHFDEIRLESVGFRYKEGQEDVLKDVNAVIRQGDFAAMTGISGVGKTSLFQLLLGIYRPTAGSVSFVSEDRVIPAGRGTRTLFAYVPQGNTLMSGTLKDNLTMFTDHASEDDISSAVHLACLDSLVDEIGLEAGLGERGIGLSEGQAQRVALARALLSDAPILLLDEATSALDEMTEAQVLQNLRSMSGKTVIAVTHRRAALAICDYSLRIEEGKVTVVGQTAP